MCALVSGRAALHTLNFAEMEHARPAYPLMSGKSRGPTGESVLDGWRHGGAVTALAPLCAMAVRRAF
eukprot:scaffold919_cov22-Tisochrysis_lutea.AAC.2